MDQVRINFKVTIATREGKGFDTFVKAIKGKMGCFVNVVKQHFNSAVAFTSLIVVSFSAKRHPN